MSTTDQLLKEISDKMDKLLRLQALELVKEIPGEQGKIELLDSLGFRPVDIAKLLNKTPENINVVLSSLRKKKGEKKTRPSAGKPQPENIDTKATAATTDQSKVEESKK